MAEKYAHERHSGNEFWHSSSKQTKGPTRLHFGDVAQNPAISTISRMERHDIIARLRTVQPTLERLGISSLRLFGSSARDEAGDESDADFIVRFRNPPTFDQFTDLKILLEETLGIAVDLVTEDALRPEMRAAVERDAICVA
jgi:uncharacterized protein